MYNWLNGFYHVMKGKYSITLLFFGSNTRRISLLRSRLHIQYVVPQSSIVNNARIPLLTTPFYDIILHYLFIECCQTELLLFESDPVLVFKVVLVRLVIIVIDYSLVS